MPASPSSSEMGVSKGSQPVPDAARGFASHPHALRPSLVKYLRDRHGVTAIEYGILVALMTLAIVGAVSTLGSQTLTQLFQKVANSM